MGDALKTAEVKDTTPLRGKILLVDDDPLILQSLGKILKEEGLDVECVSNGEAGLKKIEKENYDILLADLDLPEVNGLELLRASKQKESAPIAIVFTGFGTIEHAVTAIREGAFEFLEKPFVDDQMLLTVRRALEQKAILKENEDLKHRLESQTKFDSLIGRDHKMQKLFHLCETVADTKTTVLVTGESGTGKTMIARAIHQRSNRKNGPFVEVNCGGLPETLLESELFGSVRGAFTGAVKDKEGKFEAANGGTIFLDEIATASPALQVKLLRILQDRSFERVGDTKTRTTDVRVILATNRDLATEVREGRFREDLYYRVNVVTIEMPPLRERIGDITIIAEHFLHRFATENHRKVKTFSREALDLMLAYRWPGNVRELQNAVERAVVLCRGNKIGIEDLPPNLLQTPKNIATSFAADNFPTLKKALEEPEKQILQAALARFNGNRQETATALGINRTTLFNKMRKYGLLEVSF